MAAQTDQTCCPEFDSAAWDDKTHVWTAKRFIRETMPVFWHIPWPPMIGRLAARMWHKVENAQAVVEKNSVLFMATDPSPWRSEWYLSVDKEVPDAENVTISGTFFTKVFDGPYNAVPKWIKQVDRLLAGRNQKAKRYFFHYATCPKCAKQRGHNYVVAIAELALDLQESPRG